MNSAEYRSVIRRAVRVTTQLNSDTNQTRLLHFIGALQAGLEAGSEYALAEEVAKVVSTGVPA